MILDATTYDELHEMLQKQELFLGECALLGSEAIGVIVCSKEPDGQPQTIAVRIMGISYGEKKLETDKVYRDVEIWPLREHPRRERMRRDQKSILGWNERPQRQLFAKEVERFAKSAKQIFDTG